MPDLSTQLAALGVPAPTEAPARTPIGVVLEELHALLTEATATIPGDHVGDDLELHGMLAAWTGRLEHRLGKLGVQVIRPAVTRFDDCKHELTSVDENLSALECRTCHARLNPITWLAGYARRHTAVTETGYTSLVRDRNQKLLEIDYVKAELAILKRQLRTARAKVAPVTTTPDKRVARRTNRRAA